MRILHTSDWHLGRTLHGVPLIDAQRDFLRWLAQLVGDRRVDVVVVAGDVYDRALPGLDAVRVLEQGLDELSARAPVVLIPGNHDSGPRLGFGARWFTDRIHIQADVAAAATPIQAGGALIYAIPYLDPDLARPGVADLCGEPADGIARSHEAVLGRVLALARADLEHRRATGPRLPAVVMAHAFVTGAKPSESERDIRVGGVDAVPAQAFEGFDYAALGHLHGPQRVGGGDAMRYAGSPLAFSFSEADHHKSVALVDFDADGRLGGVELVPTPVPRHLSDVSGTLDEVLSPRFAAQRDDWVRITVRGDVRPEGLLATLRRTFPHVLEHHFAPLQTATQPRSGVGRGAVDPLEVTATFVRQATGADPTAPERDVLRRAYEAARREEGSR